MKIYLVGGAVRNQIMGLPEKDRDYVVVGSTVEEMVAAGFILVGNEFPVFIHPVTRDEYALARKEVSTGKTYHDFTVDFGPEVTLEQDAMRRDATCNAIYQDVETGEYIDPTDGIRHIRERKFVPTSPEVMEEDPVRVLRLARFLSEYPSFTTDINFNFADISNVRAERVCKEMIKALMGYKPSNFFNFLKDIGQLHIWFKELADLVGVPQPIKHHAEGDAYTHTMMVLDSAAHHNESLVVRYAALCHDFGKAVTPVDILPAHHGHEEAGVPLTTAFSDRLKVTATMKKKALAATEYHMYVHKITEMSEKKIVKLFNNIKKDIDVIASVGKHDNIGRFPYIQNDNHGLFIKLVSAPMDVKLANRFTTSEINSMSVDNRINTLHRMRIEAVKNVSI